MNTTTHKAWIEAMRLRTLPVSVSGVFAAVALAIAYGCFRWLPAILCLTFAVLAQIVSNFANEYYDFKAGLDKPGREGPRRGVTEGDITPVAMKRATYGVLALACGIGLSLIYWGGWWLIIAGIIIALGALAYSTGPYPLSRHALGEAAVVFFFGIIPVNLTFYVQSGIFTINVLLVSVAFGLMGANVLVVNNYRDIDADRQVGKTTLPNLLGRRGAMALYIVNSIVAAILILGGMYLIPFDSLSTNLSAAWRFVFIALIALFYSQVSTLLANHMRHLTGRTLNPYLGRTSILMFLTSLLLVIISLL